MYPYAYHYEQPLKSVSLFDIYDIAQIRNAKLREMAITNLSLKSKVSKAKIRRYVADCVLRPNHKPKCTK